MASPLNHHPPPLLEPQEFNTSPPDNTPEPPAPAPPASSAAASPPRTPNGCVICSTPPVCPICPTGQVCNLSAQTCQSCPAVSCVDSSTTLINPNAGLADSSAANPAAEQKPSSPQLGPIIGGVVGGVLLLCLLGFLIVYSRRKRRQLLETQAATLNPEEKETHQYEDTDTDHTTSVELNKAEYMAYAQSASNNIIYPHTKHTSTAIITKNNNNTNNSMIGPQRPRSALRPPGLKVRHVRPISDVTEEGSDTEQPLSLQQQLDYIKAQQMKLQHEELKKQQRLQHQQPGADPSPYDVYRRYVADHAIPERHPSPTAQALALAGRTNSRWQDSMLSTASSTISVSVRDSHASQIIPIAYIPGVTSNFLRSSPSLSPTSQGSHASSSTSTHASHATQYVTPAVSPVAASASQTSQTLPSPIRSSLSTMASVQSVGAVRAAVMAERAQPQLVINSSALPGEPPSPLGLSSSLGPPSPLGQQHRFPVQYPSTLEPASAARSIMLTPDTTLHSQHSYQSQLRHSGRSSFGLDASDMESLNSKTYDAEVYDEIEAYMTSPSLSASDGANLTGQTLASGVSGNLAGGSARVSRASSGSNRGSRVSRASAEGTERLHPFEYPVVYDAEEDIAYVAARASATEAIPRR